MSRFAVFILVLLVVYRIGSLNARSIQDDSERLLVERQDPAASGEAKPAEAAASSEAKPAEAAAAPAAPAGTGSGEAKPAAAAADAAPAAAAPPAAGGKKNKEPKKCKKNPCKKG